MKGYVYFLYAESYPYGGNRKEISRIDPNEYVIINEDVDLPNISVLIDRLDGKANSLPNRSKEQKVVRLKEDDFYNYLAVSMDVFRSLKWNAFEAEFFFYNPFRNGYELIMYSNDKENRYKVVVGLNTSIEEFSVVLGYSHNYRGRISLRTKALSITESLFEYILKETICFLDDDRHYRDNFKSFIKLFVEAYEGKSKPLRTVTNEVDLTPLLLSFNNEIRQLESRLINSDGDTKEARDRLRGNIEGIKMAISEIKNFARVMDNETSRS